MFWTCLHLIRCALHKATSDGMKNPSCFYSVLQLWMSINFYNIYKYAPVTRGTKKAWCIQDSHAGKLKRLAQRPALKSRQYLDTCLKLTRWANRSHQAALMGAGLLICANLFWVVGTCEATLTRTTLLAFLGWMFRKQVRIKLLGTGFSVVQTWIIPQVGRSHQ